MADATASASATAAKAPKANLHCPARPNAIGPDSATRALTPALITVFVRSYRLLLTAVATAAAMGALSMGLRDAGVALLAMPHDLSRLFWRDAVCAYMATEQ